MKANTLISETDYNKLLFLKQWLDANFLDQLSLGQIARISLLNEFKLKKGFKEIYGTTVFSHLRALRMDHASRLLADGHSVSDTAYALGYEYPQHFSTAFKKHTGYKPGHLIHLYN